MKSEKSEAVVKADAGKIEKDFEFEFATEGKLMTLPIDQITVDDQINSRNGGKGIDTSTEEFKTFVETIRSQGMIAPVSVWDQSGPGVTRYVLFAGFRRMAAAKALGFKSVQARVMTSDSAVDPLIKNILENVQREPPRPYDLACRLAHIKKKYKVSGQAIAKQVGKSDSYVNNLIRMREKLHPSVLDQWAKTEANYQACKELAAYDKDEQLTHPLYLAMIGEEPEKAGKGKGKKGRSADKWKLPPKKEVEELLSNLERKVTDPLDPSQKIFVPIKINFPGHGYTELDDDTRSTVRTVMRYMLSKWPAGNAGFYQVDPDGILGTDDEESEEDEES